MARKTIDVLTLKAAANRRLEREEYVGEVWDRVSPQQAYRMGIASLVEYVLHETDNYRGFQYLDVENWRDDETRRRYI